MFEFLRELGIVQSFCCRQWTIVTCGDLKAVISEPSLSKNNYLDLAAMLAARRNFRTNRFESRLMNREICQDKKTPNSQPNNKEAIWLYAELFLGHHDGSCHGLW